jgi:type VII secretion-associated serine protease mycosin
VAVVLTPAVLSTGIWSALQPPRNPTALQADLQGPPATAPTDAPLVSDASVPEAAVPGAAVPDPAVPDAGVTAAAVPTAAVTPAPDTATDPRADAVAPDLSNAPGPTTVQASADPARTPATAWAEPLRARPKPAANMVLGRAPVRGPVALVTVREVGGRPVVTTVDAAARGRAGALVDQALADPGVLSVSIASTVRTLAVDPYRPQLWALDHLTAEQAWARQNGAGLIVAVVDTGVAAHPDLAGVVLNGRDYVSGGTGRIDPNGHGTHVAGLIAALAGNGIGVAGLAQGVRILPVRVLDAGGAGTDANLANGIVWAVDQGASVINLSVGSADNSPAEAAAVAYAVQRGAIVVSAGGNLRKDGNPAMYPASLPGVLGVGASTQSDRAADFSNSGSYVDVVAPGVGIISTYRTNAYQSLDGSSMACAFASAAAALVKAAAPRLTPSEVMSALQRSARDIETAGRDNLSGYGLIQPVAAIALARSMTGGSAIPPGGTGSPLQPTTLTVVSAPSRATYRTTASVTYRLTVAGSALAGAPVTLCTAVAPSTGATCLTRSTGTGGQVSASVVVSGHLTLSARYAGAARAAASVARPVLVEALPQVGITAGTRSLVLTVAPTASGTVIRVQRLSGSTWTTVTSRAAPSSGQLTVTGLVSGGTYRVAIPATDRTIAATTSVVTVR